MRLRCLATGSPKPIIAFQKLDTTTVPMGTWKGNFVILSNGINLKFALFLKIIYVLNNSIFILEEVVTGNSGNSIKIIKVNRIHMGHYKCMADNGIPPSAIQYYFIETYCKYMPFMILLKFIRFFVFFFFSGETSWVT